VLDGEGMVWAWPLEQLVKVIRGALDRRSTSFLLGGGHERALAPLLVLLFDKTLGGALLGAVILLCLAFEAVEDRSDRLLARGVAGGDVEELLGGSWVLMSQLVNQGLTCGPR